ncbi:DUF1294 domain-containing protein [Marinomonas sp. C2222]|uniref:DUF1294 domain-containing protein n=2 Tax=Marinomonas sargassi TaxID=2984494 RepID=A0ABT2YTI4_9GAMM|nr:DUF1294 domain-containing protein [Marinomonas sargassi]
MNLTLYVLFYLLCLNLITFIFYGLDKWLAIKHWRRISELTLHTLSFFGGWIGALCAQKLFRHKTIKKRFRVYFWITVSMNILLAAMVTYLTFKV